jgi:uncharacterized repeat protein (TIGR03803 family)
MLAALGIVFLRVEFEPHAGRYVNYIVPPSDDEEADTSGDLFGTTRIGGANNEGTAFEITNSGFATTPSPLPPPTPVPSDFYDNGYSDILLQNTNGEVGIWDMNGSNVISAAAVGFNQGPSWKAIGTGDFNGDGQPDILLQNTND